MDVHNDVNEGLEVISLQLKPQKYKKLEILREH